MCRHAERAIYKLAVSNGDRDKLSSTYLFIHATTFMAADSK